MSELDDPRVLFSAERTLLSWNRTSLQLIAFGFLVERSGLIFDEFRTTSSPIEANATFWLGVAFIVLGSFSAIHSTRQFRRTFRSLSASEIPPGYSSAAALTVNIVVALLGLALAVGVYVVHT